MKKNVLTSLLNDSLRGFRRIWSWIQRWNKENAEKQITYWSGRLGKKFETFDEMCGARDAYLMKHRLANQTTMNEVSKIDLFGFPK
jgi:hypothetical protein